MHILLDYRPALSRRTGVGEYAHELAAALARTRRPDDRLTLFTSSWTDRPDPALSEWPGVAVVDRRVPVRVLNYTWHRCRWPPVEWLAGSIDVAQSLHPLVMPTRSAHQVVTIYDLDFLTHPERTTAEVRRDYPKLVRDSADRAALVVVISGDTARAVQRELGVSGDRLVVCRPGLPGWIGAPRQRPAPDPGYVLFVGTLEPRKNIGALLDAWTLLVKRRSQLPKLRLAGAARPEAGTWLARLQVPPLAGTVEYIGYIPDADRRATYEGAQLLVLPSWHEGFGLPALEAMALGVPVVASNRGALPEVVGDAGLLVAPDDTRGLAAAIAAVLDDPVRAAAMSARGLVQAAGFTWDAAAHELRRAYDRLPSVAPGTMMRIGVDAREIGGHATGVGRYLERLLQEWAAARVPHHWTLYSPDGRLGVPPGLDAEVAVVPGAGGTRWEQGALASAIAADRPDVFFAPGYSAPLRARCPLVVVIHDVSFAAHPEWFRWREGLRRRWLAKQSAHRARVVVTVSGFSRDEIARHLGVSPSRIRVIPHGIGLPAVSSGEPREPMVLFAGSMFNRRHLPVLIEGFSLLARRRPDIRLELVGANRTHPHQPIDALIAASGFAERINLRDWVDDRELASLYRRASAFAFLSEYEGFGLTPLEALASGVPPVVLDTLVAREVLRDAAVFVAQPNAELVADALDSAMAGATRTQVLAAAQDVLVRYDWHTAAAATLAALEDAARA